MVFVELGAIAVFAGLVSAWTLWVYPRLKTGNGNPDDGQVVMAKGVFTTGECVYGLQVPGEDGGLILEEDSDTEEKELESSQKQSQNAENTEEEDQPARVTRSMTAAAQDEPEQPEPHHHHPIVAERKEKEDQGQDASFEEEAENVETPDVLYWDGEKYSSKEEEEAAKE